MLKMQNSEGHLGGYILGQAAPGTWCPAVWDWFINDLNVKSVLDVGCGLGYVLEYFNKNGCNVYGVDGSPTAIRDNVMPGFVDKHDFSLGPWESNYKCDLVWSSEFVEHVEKQFVGNFLLAFNRASKYVAMTFAVPGQGGHHHVNENTEDYWIRTVQLMNFTYCDKLTKIARSLIPDEGREGKQFRSKGLIFKNNYLELTTQHNYAK